MINFQQKIPVHEWIKNVSIAWVPGYESPLINSTVAKLLDCFRAEGHTILPKPGGDPEAM